MKKWILLISVFLFCPGCKVVAVFSVSKDWAVDSPSIYQPDMRTGAELRFERDWE